MGPELESALLNARVLLEEKMSSEDACTEYLSAMGHVDGALRDLRVRSTRLGGETERQRIEEEARANDTYAQYEEGLTAAQELYRDVDPNEPPES